MKMGNGKRKSVMLFHLYFFRSFVRSFVWHETVFLVGYVIIYSFLFRPKVSRSWNEIEISEVYFWCVFAVSTFAFVSWIVFVFYFHFILDVEIIASLFRCLPWPFEMCAYRERASAFAQYNILFHITFLSSSHHRCVCVFIVVAVTSVFLCSGAVLFTFFSLCFITIIGVSIESETCSEWD